MLVGHDGPHHINIAEGKPILRSLRKYHGSRLSASVEFKLREGPITMLSIGVTSHGKFKFVIAEGRAHGLIPATGNTNTRGYLNPTRVSSAGWPKGRPTISPSAWGAAATLARIAELLGIQYAIVTPCE